MFWKANSLRLKRLPVLLLMLYMASSFQQVRAYNIEDEFQAKDLEAAAATARQTIWTREVHSRLMLCQYVSLYKGRISRIVDRDKLWTHGVSGNDWVPKFWQYEADQKLTENESLKEASVLRQKLIDFAGSDAVQRLEKKLSPPATSPPQRLYEAALKRRSQAWNAEIKNCDQLEQTVTDYAAKLKSFVETIDLGLMRGTYGKAWMHAILYLDVAGSNRPSDRLKSLRDKLVRFAGEGAVNEEESTLWEYAEPQDPPGTKTS